MYHALIVDDEIHAAAGIEQGVRWETLDVTEVYTAHSVRQAKEIMADRSIDIVICDIEMPQGNGFELQQWIRDGEMRTETIFLTCHAEFHYAQQAVQLGGLEYMLKPVRFPELERILSKALDKIKKARDNDSFNETLKHYYNLWSIHQPLLVERFWMDVVHREISSQRDSLSDVLERRRIPYTPDSAFELVLAVVRHWHRPLDPKDNKIMAYALRNAAEHLYGTGGQACHTVQLKTDALLILLPTGERQASGKNAHVSLSEAYIESCNRFFYCDVSCYIGHPVVIAEVPDLVERLLERDVNNVNGANRVFILSDALHTDLPVAMPDMTHWAQLLKQGAGARLVRELAAYLDQLIDSTAIDAQYLYSFSQDYAQMIYYVLKLQGLQAHRIYSDKRFQQLSAESTRSVRALRQWAVQMVETAIHHLHGAKEPGTVVERVKRYIEEHIGDQLNRDEVASHFYLHPDYLSRIFKKETGQLLSDYLLQERIRLSRELLANTDLPVSAVAMTVGYGNFSHYAKIFKQATGFTPQEYRKVHT